MFLQTADIDDVFSYYDEGYKPTENISVTEWAEKYRVLDTMDSNEAGKYRVSRTPYLREVMDNLGADSKYNEIWVQKSSQTGFTTAALNAIGYWADVCPGPTLLMMPNKELLKKTSQSRIDPMIMNTPKLKRKFADKDGKEGYTLYEKYFTGGFLSLGSAETPNTGRSTPFKYGILDEVSKYKKDIGGEGDWIKLIRGRFKTFKNSYKLFGLSTPGIEGECVLTKEFLKTDQRYYFVPCVKCGHYQILEWERIIWEKDDDGQPILDSVRYVCSEKDCGFEHEERHKTKMLAKGEWRPTVKNPQNKKAVGYNFSSLYCPVGWYGWKEMVTDFYEAKSSKEEMIAFVNTALGKAWSERSEDTPKWNKLYNRRSSFTRDVIPMEASHPFLIATADVQKNRIEVGIFAFKKRKDSPVAEMWVMDHIVLMGDTSSDPMERYYTDHNGNELETPWYKYKKLLTRLYESEGDSELIPISAAAIDGGYETQNVYNFSRQFSHQFMHVVKGDPKKNKAVNAPTMQDIKKNSKGRRVTSGARIYPLGSSLLKEAVYQRLSINVNRDATEYPASYVHFSNDIDEESFKQLTGEDMIKEKDAKTGYDKVYWKKNRQRNEFLDLTAYALALYEIRKYHKIKAGDWNRKADAVNEKARIYTQSIAL